MQIPKIRLHTFPESEEAEKAVGYEWNMEAGKRHFLGGSPDNVRKEEFPDCDECNEKMTFYSQIDSIGDDYDLADCMVIHTYVCFSCFTVKSNLSQI